MITGSRGLQAPHARHRLVKEHHVELGLAHELERVLAVGGGRHLVALLLEEQDVGFQ
jgi:hypothetical protein